MRECCYSCASSLYRCGRTTLRVNPVRWIKTTGADLCKGLRKNNPCVTMSLRDND